MTSLILFTINFLLYFSSYHCYVNNKPIFLTIEDFSCIPCARPALGLKLELRSSRPPCLHTGQPLFQWPSFEAADTDYCSFPVEFDSDELSLDPESKLTFTRTRVCFYDSEWMPKFRIRCVNQTTWQVGTLRIVHEKFSKRHRLKRWLRRRNPHLSPIHFQKDRYVVEVPEDADVKSPVIKITATHENDRLLYYSMLAPEDTRSSNIFSLDTVTGEITLAKPMDKETLDKHVLKVTAYERLDPSISSSTTVIIDVLDVQDNSPVFERSSYYSEIREDAPIGTTVLSVFARDLDSGLNGEVEYSLSDDFGSDLLKINANSGVIQTAKELDRERLASIRLNVIASDKGKPRMSSTANIEVAVLDVNDNAPVFEMETCDSTILENITVPHQILKITAKDVDSGVNGKVHYSIVTSSIANSFSIDYETGELTLRSPISPKQSPITLMIRAKDGGQPALSSTISCTVNILDVNDHAPVFLSSSMHEILVDEDVAVGYELGRIFAVDEDSGPNGDVRYRLENVDGSASDTFNIDKTTGVIRTSTQLDRELKDRYLLKIVAEDGGSPSLNSSLNVVVSVKDVNDNKPVFSQEAYHLTLTEDTPRGTPLLTLHATDADEDQKLVYRIEYNPRNLFALANVGDGGAILSLAQAFSPKDHQLEVHISATDQGGLQGYCNVSIRINDINGAPFFVETPFTIRIPENSPIGFHVVQMKAEDPDRGINANLSYSIDVDDFRIDTLSGLITVANELDRERQASYTINITVSDSGDPPLSSSTILEVFLEDVNDNAPVFERSTYAISIPEDMPVGTSFLQITASDPDEGANAIVDYFLNASDPFVLMDKFRLDRTSGTLRINKALDREKTETYILPIIAKDRGRPSLSSEKIVTITLGDINDNAPKFEQPSYDLWIAENSPVGTVVGTVRAFDFDVDENAQIEFRIFGGPDAKLFDIEADTKEAGVVHILSRNEFDYEAKTNKFFIELQASSGQLSSTVPLAIHVSDVNDNPPQLKDFMILIANFDAEKDREIGGFPSFDPDQNATIEYYLEPNDVVDVAPFTGKLTLKNFWNRQLDLTSKACVSDGPNTVCVKCHTTYVAVNEEALRESLTLQITGLNRDQFLDFPVFQRFLDAMSVLDDSWASENIRVFSVNSIGHSLNVSFFAVGHDDRPIRDSYPISTNAAFQTNTLICASELGTFQRKCFAYTRVSSWKVENALFCQLRNLSELFGYAIRLLQDDQCLHEPCPYYQKCRQSLKYVNVKKTFETDSFVMRSLDTLRTFVCECPQGFTTSTLLPGYCNQRLDLCYNNPCLNNGTCYPLENSYKCECLPNWTGPNCEFSVFVDTCLPITCQSGSVCKLKNRHETCHYCRWSQADSDENCRLKSLTFNGDSYFVIPKTLSRVEWKLEFKIATIAPSAILLHAGNRNRSDFLEVGLKGGLLRAELSLGGNEKIQIALPDWKENRLNDGEWHKISIIFYNRKLRLSIDDCDSYLSINFHKIIGYAQCAVESSINLPKRCEDPALRCNRFFDANMPIILGGYLLPSDAVHNHVENGFAGCLRDFHLDSQLVHFSDFQSFEQKGVEPGCQKSRPDKCAFENPCSDAKCLDKWGGTLCKCNHRVHLTKNCNMESSTPIALFSDESYVSWRLPARIPYPFKLYFEFRTRERKIQVMALEFELRSQFFLFSLESGQSMVQVSSAGQYFIPYPVLADGNWHSVQVDFGTTGVNVTIDHLYDKNFPFHGSISFSTILALYSGFTPSTSHPARFSGCVRNVEVNGNKLKILDQSKTKPGCHAANGCDPVLGMCPATSKCLRDWDRHSCRCHSGYVGDGCVDVCSITKICGPKGVCIRSNNTRGYDCLCPEGLAGENCERQALTKTCPLGWFGTFPQCRKCDCKTSKGFRQQCDLGTGRCLCEPGFYELNSKCVPCECGYGSVSTVCSENGQCQCSGEAAGRRCDRCKDSSKLLDRKILQCQKISNKCPSNIEYGVQWPTTGAGALARHSCPTQMGIATRKCSKNGQWAEVDNSNCSLPLLYDLQLKISTDVESMEILRLLVNITKNFHYISMRNIDDVSKILTSIIAHERQLNNSTRSFNLRDLEFTEMVLLVMEHLFDQPLFEEQFLNLLSLVYDFGSELARLYKESAYLKPFQSVNEKFSFFVDRFDRKTYEKPVTLPKYDHFARPKQSFNENRILITPSHYDTIFFSIVDEPQCRDCFHPFVLVHHESLPTHPAQIQISIRLNEEAGWKYPECAQLVFDQEKTRPKMEFKWNSVDGLLIGLNRTHAMCQFEFSSGIFTVLARSGHGALVQFSLPTGQIPYATPICAFVSLFLCAFALISSLLRNGLQTRFIRCALICAFVLDAAAFLFIARVTIKPVFCPVRNAVVTFVSSALFAWIFAYSLQIYKILVDGHSGSCHTITLIMGIVLPSLVSTSSFLISNNCSLTFLSWSFWLLIGPVGLFLLLSFYALSTSFLLSTDKQYELLVSKFSLRNTLISHSILTILCTLYNSMCIYALISNQTSLKLEMSTNILLLLTSIYILLWTNYFSHTKPKNRKTDVLWVNDEAPKSMLGELEPECNDPLLAQGEKVYGGLPNEWMPDIIPTETYIHHTLQRSLQRVPQILSPPQKVFDPIPPQYANTICVSDMAAIIDSPASMKIVRTGSSAGAYASKFGSTVDDQMDDAYYTYTARRKKPPATTFGN